MEWYISAGGDFNKLELYNCSAAGLTQKEWYSKGVKNPSLGYILLAYGVIIEFMYIPCLIVITRPEYFKMSCYKIMTVLGLIDMLAIGIMTVLGLIDMLAIGVNSICTGYLMADGAMFCNHPHFIFIAGSIGLGMWCAACLSCLILVCNRLLEMWKPYLMDSVFGGKRTIIIMMVAIFYGLCFTFFTHPIIFTSQNDAWFFDTFIYEGRSVEYANYPHTVNNLLLVFLTCILYTALCGILGTKFRSDMNNKMSWNQKSIFIQSSVICVANLIAALIYVLMNFFPTPHACILLGHMCWQLCHGSPAIVYLTINRTVRREVLKMFGFSTTTSSMNAHSQKAETTAPIKPKTSSSVGPQPTQSSNTSNGIA